MSLNDLYFQHTSGLMLDLTGMVLNQEAIWLLKDISSQQVVTVPFQRFWH